MGLSCILSSSINEGYERKSPIEPNPKVFKIIKAWHRNGNVVVLINYPNCTNYEGNKVCIFKNQTEKSLGKIPIVDPHFSESGLAPFARFEPTDEGWVIACKMLDLI